MGGQYQPIGQSHLIQNIIDYNMTVQEGLDLPRAFALNGLLNVCLLYTSPSPRDMRRSRMPSSA